jgi:glycosyl transferase family 25
MENIVYINLDSRPDRKLHMEQQLSILGWNATRLQAVKLQNGALGCSMSHLRCIENAIKDNVPYLIVLEDDTVFLNPELFKQQFELFKLNNPNFDVLLLAGNNLPPYYPVDDTCIKISHCQTTTAYVVNNHYLPTLANNIKEGIKQFILNPDEARLYAIDKYWIKLQKIHNWYLLMPVLVIQKPDYSDIENKYVDYTELMLDLDKSKYIKQKQKHDNHIQKKSWKMDLK